MFLLLLGALVYMEATKPQPINWFPSYHKEDKIPLGTLVINKLLHEIFQKKFIEVDAPPFEVLKNNEVSGTYLFINDEIGFDEVELDSILNWVHKGNNIFISANYLGDKLLDTLKVKTSTVVNVEKIGTEPLVKLVNKKFATPQPFHIKKDLPVRYFSEIDTLRQTVLGVSGGLIDSIKIKKPRKNFLKMTHGKGQLFLHLQPEVFSNFFILSNKNAQHTAQVLSYINNNNNLYWDNYYKSGKRLDVSPLRVLLKNKYFKWAYYFVLIGVLLFIIFEGKRKQRSIPIVKPLQNKTYEYTRTIAGIYLEKKEYKLIAEKQIKLFMEYIRTRLQLNPQTMDKVLLNKIAERSGNSFKTTEALFNFIEQIQRENTISKANLQKLYHDINDFKKKTDGKS